MHLIITIAACLSATNQTAAVPPNVLVVLADDQGWGDLGANGNKTASTPHIDRLARDGAMFDRFYVQPLCAPTRAEFLTGRYHPRGGVSGVSTGLERLDLDETTIAQAFRAADYATGCFGKWHNGTQSPYHPNDRGFDEFYGFTAGHWGDYFSPPLDHNGQPVRGDGYLPDDVTNRAIDFMQANVKQSKPFFCFVAYNTPHGPMQVPDKYWDKYKDAELQQHGTRRQEEMVRHTRAALAMNENLDDNVGRMLEALRDEDVESDTIVVYFTDNGPNGHRWNGGMKGIKGSLDEGGVRSPLFIRWPGHIKPQTEVAAIAGAIDLYPTLAGLADVPIAGEKPLDGVDLAPLLIGGAAAPERVVFHHWAGKTVARDQRFRLDQEGQLFDMDADPGQRENISSKQSAVAKRLRSAVDAFRRDVLAELPERDERPFPVGFGTRAATELPARDGVPHGGVQRSAKAPNCSYFTHWTSTDDRMTWDVEIGVPSRFEAIVHYTCPADAVGAVVELSLGDQKLAGKIAEPHDPPLRGPAQDRFRRGGETGMKEFKPLSLGTFELPAGRNQLVLRAIDVPGEQVADVWAVTLVRQAVPK